MKSRASKLEIHIANVLDEPRKLGLFSMQKTKLK